MSRHNFCWMVYEYIIILYSRCLWLETFMARDAAMATPSCASFRRSESSVPPKVANGRKLELKQIGAESYAGRNTLKFLLKHVSTLQLVPSKLQEIGGWTVAFSCGCSDFGDRRSDKVGIGVTGRCWPWPKRNRHSQLPKIFVGCISAIPSNILPIGRAENTLLLQKPTAANWSVFFPVATT